MKIEVIEVESRKVVASYEINLGSLISEVSYEEYFSEAWRALSRMELQCKMHSATTLFSLRNSYSMQQKSANDRLQATRKSGAGVMLLWAIASKSGCSKNSKKHAGLIIIRQALK